MGRNKSVKELREKKTTIIFCRETKIYDIVSVLRNFKSHKLWEKTKYQWTLSEWEEYFELKQIVILIQGSKNE